MSDGDLGQWRTPSLDKLGDSFAKLDRATERRRRRPLRLALGSSAVAACAVAAAVLVLAGTRTADASSPVSRAPTAVVRAGSVAYRASTEVSVDGRIAASLTARGAMDLRVGSYRAVVRRSGGVASVERVRIGRYLYSGIAAGGLAPARWIGIPLGHKGLLSDPDVPGSGALTDPPAVLRAMSLIRGHPRSQGSATIDGTLASAFTATTTLASFFADTAIPATVGRQPVALTVWIDRKGRPVRVREQLTSFSGRATLTTVWTFSEFGRPVTIAAPTAGVERAAHGSLGPDPLARSLTTEFLGSATEPAA